MKTFLKHFAVHGNLGGRYTYSMNTDKVDTSNFKKLVKHQLQATVADAYLI